MWHTNTLNTCLRQLLYLSLKAHFSVTVCICEKLLQSCLTLWGPVDRGLVDSSVHGILPARTLLQEIFLTQGSSPHLLCLLHLQVGSLPLAPPGKSFSVISALLKIMIYLIVNYFLFSFSNSSPQAIPTLSFSITRTWNIYLQNISE